VVVGRKGCWGPSLARNVFSTPFELYEPIYDYFCIAVRRAMTELQAKLASLSIFKELDAAELASLAEPVQWFSIIGGSILISEGRPAYARVSPPRPDIDL
jgi:hypothetical protein